MIFDTRSIPPAFIVDTIPGAPELREAVIAARSAFDTAGDDVRRTGEELRDKAIGALGEMTPREGVTQAALDEAEDAYRHATEAVRVAESAHSAALRRLHAKVSAGAQTEAFKASHTQLAREAESQAVTAAVALWKALEARDEFDAAIGQRRDPSAGAPYDRTYWLRGIGAIVNARVVTRSSRAMDDLELGVRTPADRVELAKRLGLF